MPPMSDEPLTRAVLASTLAEFHRTIVLPDIQRVVGEVVGEAIGEFRREVNGHFDDIYRRFERLETEYDSVKAGLARVEERLDRLELGYQEMLAAVHRLEERLSRVERQVSELAAAEEKHALRSEVQDLKARVDALRDEVRRLEQRLQA